MSEARPNSPKPSAQGWARIVHAGLYSLDGLRAAYRSEAAFRQLVWLHSVLLIWQGFWQMPMGERMLLIAVSFLSLIVELLNTGIEALTDRVSTEWHPLSKIAKDVGSAAQFLTLTLVIILWLMMLYDRCFV